MEARMVAGARQVPELWLWIIPSEAFRCQRKTGIFACKLNFTLDFDTKHKLVAYLHNGCAACRKT